MLLGNKSYNVGKPLYFSWMVYMCKQNHCVGWTSEMSMRVKCGCVGHCGTNSKLNGVEVRTANRPLNPLHCQILELVSDEPYSVEASIVSPVQDCGDMGLLENLILIYLSNEIPSNGWWTLFVQRMRCHPIPSHCLHQKLLSYCCSNLHNVLCIVPVLTLKSTCHKQNQDSSLNITLPTLAQKGIMVTSSIVCFLAAALSNQRLAVRNLF